MFEFQGGKKKTLAEVRKISVERQSNHQNQIQHETDIELIKQVS